MRGRLHTYARFDDRVPPSSAVTDDEAIAELSRRYFTTRGPATVKDFVWWSGLSTSEARRGVEMAKKHLSSQSLDDRTYWFAEAAVPRPRHRVDLVQCYDEAIISYSESRDVLQTEQVSFAVPGHLDGFSHVVLMNGRLAGHWRPAPSTSASSVEGRIRRPLDSDEQRALASQVGRYVGFVDG